MAVYRFEHLVVGSGAPVAPSSASLGGHPVRSVFVSVQTQNVRYRYDGGDPTPTEGHLLVTGRTLTLEGAEAHSQLKFIAVTLSADVFLTQEAS